jgi:hypothetical protein
MVFAKAPVDHQHFAIGTDHDVIRLQVAMHYAARVGKGESVADLPKDAQKLIQGVSVDCARIALANLFQD